MNISKMLLLVGLVLGSTSNAFAKKMPKEVPDCQLAEHAQYYRYPDKAGQSEKIHFFHSVFLTRYDFALCTDAEMILATSAFLDNCLIARQNDFSESHKTKVQITRSFLQDEITNRNLQLSLDTCPLK